MFFRFEDQFYTGDTAVEIVWALARDTPKYNTEVSGLSKYVRWSLEQMEDRIPRRELDVSDTLAEETIAYAYLCVLDRYNLGKLYDPPSEKARGRFKPAG
jgi:hypothetical protein